MPRLIDANRIVYSWTIDNDGEEHDGVTLQSIIDKMPTVDAEPVRYGRWQVNEVDGYKDMTCLSCGWLFEYYDGLEEEWNYCPHCGAKMDESTIPSDKTYTLYANDKPILTYTESGIVLHGERKEDETD